MAHHTTAIPQEPPTTSQQADYTTADIMSLHATCTEPTMPVGTSQNPPDKSPEQLVKREMAEEDCQAHEHVDVTS